MAGKNTAVFGIYKSAAEAERGADALISAGFPNADISVLMPDFRAPSNLPTRKTRRRPRVRRRVSFPAEPLAEPWDSWPELERWPSLASVLS